MRYIWYTTPTAMKTLITALALVLTTGLYAQDAPLASDDGAKAPLLWEEDGWILFEKYHPNGRVKERGAWVGGKPAGMWTQYDVEGNWTARVRFAHGLRNGRCLFREPGGEEIYRVRYANGKLMYGTKEDGQGEVIAERIAD
jgi:hypothetical protein